MCIFKKKKKKSKIMMIDLRSKNIKKNNKKVEPNLTQT